MAKQRLTGEGSITFFKPRNLWYGRVSHNGKRIGVYRKTQKEVKQALRDLQLKKHQGLRLEVSSMLLKDFLPQWVDLQRNSLRDHTYMSYESIVRIHLVPRLGRYKLNNISTDIISRTWAEMIKEGYSPSIVNHCHRRLSVALNWGIKRNLIQVNPCVMATVPKEIAKDIHPLDLQEIDEVLEQAKLTPYYPVIHTALQTGARRNELLALDWRDIDLNRSVIHISKSLHVGKGGLIMMNPPKTKNGKRSVALSPEAVISLRTELQNQIDNGLYHGFKVSDNTPVFINAFGDRILPNSLTHGFKKIIRKLNLNDSIDFHDTRHTHATLLLRNGVHPKIVQERLGHSSIKVTLDTYSHVIPNMQTDAIQSFTLVS